MKLDINIKRVGVRATSRVILVMASMMTMASVGRAEDILSGLADPTQPAYGNAMTSGGVYAGIQKSTGPTLQSTFVSSSQRRAMISGKSYRVGDKFGGGEIAGIEPYEVVLKQAGRETRLRLLPKVINQAYIVKVPANSQEGDDENDKTNERSE